jgi:hypothetical protein
MRSMGGISYVAAGTGSGTLCRVEVQLTRAVVNHTAIANMSFHHFELEDIGTVVQRTTAGNGTVQVPESRRIE